MQLLLTKSEYSKRCVKHYLHHSKKKKKEKDTLSSDQWFRTSLSRIASSRFAIIRMIHVNICTFLNFKQFKEKLIYFNDLKFWILISKMYLYEFSAAINNRLVWKFESSQSHRLYAAKVRPGARPSGRPISDRNVISYDVTERLTHVVSIVLFSYRATRNSTDLFLALEW